MKCALAALVLFALALLSAGARAESPLRLSPESGTAPVELRPEAGGFSAKFVVENRGSAPVRVTLRPRPGSSTLPRLPASVGVAFEGGRADATLAAGERKSAVVRWVVREPSPQRIDGHVIAETESGDVSAIGVYARQPWTFLQKHSLSLLIGLPLLGVLLLLGLYFGRYEKLRNLRFVATGVALAQLGVAGNLYTSFDVGLSRYHGSDGFQFVHAAPLLPALGIELIAGVDGISVVFVMLAPLVLLIASLSGDSVTRRQVAFWSFALLLEAAVLGGLVALDLALFLLAWVIASGAVIALVGAFGGGGGRHGTRTAAYLAISAASIALAVFTLAGHSGTAYLLDGTEVTRTFSFIELSRIDFLGAGLASRGVVKLASVALFVGCAIPIALVPFHGWLVAALRNAPAALGVILVGCVAPLGIYALIRIGYGLLPDGMLWAARTLGVLGVAGALVAAIAAVAERDLARFAGYATAVHSGLAVLSVSGMTAIGVEGAIALAVASALAGAGLMVVTGMLRARVGTADSGRLGGVASDAPVLAVLAGGAFLGSLALPGTLAFAGISMSMVGALPRHPALVAAVALVALASAAAHAVCYARIFFGEVPETWRQSRQLEAHGGRFPELEPQERTPLLVPVALGIVLGFAPSLLLRLSDSSALDYAERVNPPGPTEVVYAPTSPSNESVLALNSRAD